MREIKFRAKHLNRDKFVYGDLVLKCSVPHIVTSSGVLVGININTVGQFTGLYENNGKEIYEGDILLYYGLMKIVVVFNHGAFGYYSRSDDFITFSQNVNFSFWKNDEDDKFESIGNIYDNPELIKESEETK